MRGITELVGEYLRIVLSYWWTLLPGLALPIIDLIDWFRPEEKKRKIPSLWKIVVTTACLVIAQFLAFRNSQQNLAKVIDEKRQQSIQINYLTAKLTDTHPSTIRERAPQKKPSSWNATLRARQTSSGPNSPNVASVTQGSGSIAQIGGENNQAVINPEPREKRWVISEADCKTLLRSIKSTGSVPVSIGAFISDPDGANVVRQLARCLPSVPGWTVSTAALPPVPPVPDGVSVVASSDSEALAVNVRDGLRSLGFSAETRVIPLVQQT